MNTSGDSLQFTISIFSPRNSSTIALTRAPFIPTHAPTASTSGICVVTAILVRDPASLAMLLISTVPSWISVTSSSKSLLTNSGCVRDTVIRGPFGVSLTSTTYNLICSVGRKRSPGTCSLSIRIASTFPRLIQTFLPL